MSSPTERETKLLALREAITTTLRAHNIPFEEWGVGKAKTIEHLVREVYEGETKLIEEGELLRRLVELIRVDVRHILSDGKELHLVEDRQQFSDGRERRRDLQWVSEKMKPGEDMLVAAKRALREELGIEDDVAFNPIATLDQTEISHSYPGLESHYRIYELRTYLNPSMFNPEGYIEDDGDKTTFFVWQEIPSEN